MATGIRDSSAVLTRGNAAQYQFLIDLYPQALQLKSESKKKKPEELRKFDDWYHEELPKKIQHRRTKEGTGYLVHEELVQTIKWKLARGKWRPRLKELVTMNTPRVVMVETKKAIRHLTKKHDLPAAIQAMCNLKGVGPAMASAVLCATMPESIPYMSDECLLSMPGMEDRSIEYTVAEYLKMVEHVRATSNRLSAAGHTSWTPCRVEQVLFSHHVIVHNKPELLENMPIYSSKPEVENGSSKQETNDEAGTEKSTNGESSTPPDIPAADSVAPPTEDSCDAVTATEDSCDAVASTEDSCDAVAATEDSCDAVAATGNSCDVLAASGNDATAVAATDDDVTNDSVVSVAGSSLVDDNSNMAVIEDESSTDVTADVTTVADTTTDVTTDVTADQTQALAASNGTQQDKKPSADESAAEGAGDVIRAKRGADECADNAAPAKCAKSDAVECE